jgi:hypothetical protein
MACGYFIFSSYPEIIFKAWKGDYDMKGTECRTAYEQYRDTQIEWASAEDLLLVLAQELVRLKEETGMNLFWDDTEEQVLRDYIENAGTVLQS